MAEARFVGMLDYLAALKRSKLTADPAKMDTLFQGCILDIENAPAIAMEAGTSLLKRLASADLPEKWHEDLANLVQKKVQAGLGEQSLKKNKVSKNQHCENLQNYFLQSDWDEMAQNPGVLKKCMTMSNRLALLGLLNPDEQTSVAAVAIAYVAAHKGAMDELRVNPMKALCTVRDFKSHIRNLKGYSRADITVFPADPGELPEDLLKRAYGHQIPVQCPVDEMAVKFLRSVLPARDTHASIRGMCGKPGLQQFQGNSGGLDNTLMMRLKALLDQSGQAQDTPLTLTMLPPTKSKPLLALEMDPVASAGSTGATSSTPAEPVSSHPQPAKKDQAGTPAEPAEEVLPKDEEQKEEKPKGAHNKGVEEMANEILGVLGDKQEAKPKAKASAKKAAATKKKPAAAVAEPEEPPNKKAKGMLPFPGEGPVGPVRYKNVTIYICPGSFSYRVKLAGEKKDKAFSWKVDGAKATWGRVRQHVLSLV